MTTALRLTGRHMPVYAAVAQMRATSSHLAVLRDRADLGGVLTLSDALRRLFPVPGRSGTPRADGREGLWTATG